MKERVERIFEWLLEILFPRAEKLLLLENITRNNGLRSLPRGEKSSEKHFSLFSYRDSLVKELVWQIKYHRNPLLTKEVGVLLYEEILEIISDSIFFRNQEEVLLVPVPMSPKRKRERGWNQTEEIAKAILANDSANTLSYQDNALEKKENVLPQTETSSRKDRLKNAVGAYAVKNSLLIQGKTIIVIDDVETTGATFQEIERVLRQAGVSQVLCFSIAH